mmetsp:Transcript_11279/g.21241  ORF Transcript_11279/g.21241 Transcript_11279/m.21241 type:complete len:148 (-) Transcript_11279:159-602(-)
MTALPCIGTAKYAYVGSNIDPNSVSMHAGEKLTVLEQSHDQSWALIVLSGGKHGWVPSICLTLEKSNERIESPKLASTLPPGDEPTVIVTHPDYMDQNSRQELHRTITDHQLGKSPTPKAGLLARESTGRCACIVGLRRICCGFWKK